MIIFKKLFKKVLKQPPLPLSLVEEAHAGDTVRLDVQIASKRLFTVKVLSIIGHGRSRPNLSSPSGKIKHNQ